MGKSYFGDEKFRKQIISSMRIAILESWRICILLKPLVSVIEQLLVITLPNVDLQKVSDLNDFHVKMQKVENI